MISFSIFVCCLFSNVVFANDNITYFDTGYIQEIETTNIDTRQWIVVDSGIQYILIIDYANHYIQIDDEVIPYSVEEISIPPTRATINYSTARNFSSKIPWKGSTILLTAAITAAVAGVAAAGWAATIAGALTADAENIYLTFTQYDSVESYYSSYHGYYYKKCINKNITFYENEIDSDKIIYGPVDGNWFDPVRPS